MNPLIDFTLSSSGFREYGGSDSKRSIEYDNKKYMLKLPERKDKKANQLQTSTANNVLSEYLGSHIVASVGLPVHNTTLGVCDEELVVACEDFTTKEEKLQEFTWFVLNIYRKKEIGKIPTYNQIYETINSHPLLHSISEQAIQRYWETFVMDALIGNFDRHKGNWGYLVNEEKKTVSLAPVYDCGSCLYPSLSEEGMKIVLKDEAEIAKRLFEFPKPALLKAPDFRHEQKFTYHEMLLSKEPYCKKALLKIFPKINCDKINNIIDETFVLSDIRKRFYKTMLTERYEKILKPAYEKHREITTEEALINSPQSFSPRI